MLIKFWGVHGSLPRPGRSTLKYGGNTACVEVRCGKTLIILDAGTGIRELGEELMRRQEGSNRNPDRIVGHIFFSHLHWDHVQGFPFFDPVFKRGNEFHLYGSGDLDRAVYQVLKSHMSPPNFPVKLEDLPASLDFHHLIPGDQLSIDGVTVVVGKLNHPGGSCGYRLEYQGSSLVYASDTEQVDGMDRTVADLARDADVLIHDSMFAPDQYLGLWDDIPRQSWGHSTWESAIEVARAARVKRLILFHHGNDDTVVEAIEKSAQEIFPATAAAYEGLELEF
ncbi:MAG: MBL fold metallo-hydrolase [Desulfomonile tiedjei]|nr:MBL fold metallo-hydrolase [Desulfomonile tiedjei]